MKDEKTNVFKSEGEEEEGEMKPSSTIGSPMSVYSTKCTSPTKRERSVSPDQHYEAKKVKSEQLTMDEEDFKEEIDAISITDSELKLLSFVLIDRSLNEDEQTKMGKLFKLWRKVKDEKNKFFYSKNLCRLPTHGVATSWKQFAQYASEGYEKIFAEINKRRGYKMRSLATQRESCHFTCVDLGWPCAVFLKENHCKKCEQEGIVQEDKSVESKYRDRSQTRSNEHETHGSSYDHERSEQYEYAQDRYDRSSRSRYGESVESHPYGQRSYQRSNVADRASRSKGASQDDSWRNEETRYFELQKELLNLQKRQTEEFQSMQKVQTESLESVRRLQSEEFAQVRRELHLEANRNHDLGRTIEGLEKRMKRLEHKLDQSLDQRALVVRLSQLEKTVANLERKDQRLTDLSKKDESEKEG